MYISLFTVAIPVNYTSEFRVRCEATTYRPTTHLQPTGN